MHSKSSSRNFLRFVCLSLLLATLGARAASVGVGGYTNAFPSQPAAIDFAGGSIGGGSGDVTDATAFDTAVATVTAASVNTQLALVTGTPPGAAANGVYNDTDKNLQLRATGSKTTLIMGTFTNNAGGSVSSVRVIYNLTQAAISAEQIDGVRVYYSLTGAASSWTYVPTWSATAAGQVNAEIVLSGPWTVNSPLYLLIADDNGSPSPDTANQIDNFSLTPTAIGAVNSVTLSTPANGSIVPGPAVINLTAAASAAAGATVSRVAYYYTNSGAVTFVGSSAAGTTYPVSTASLGSGIYGFYAVMTNSLGAVVNSLTNVVSITSPIVVGALGSGVQTFTTLPSVSQWTTFSYAGAGNATRTDAEWNGFVNANSAANITTVLETKTASGTGGNAYWRSDLGRIVTQPTGNAGTLLMATLFNASGFTVNNLNVTYEMSDTVAVTEDHKGHRLYYSTTGLINSWTLFGSITNSEINTKNISLTLPSLGWAQNSVLYLIWADENGLSPDGDWSIDNINFVPGGSLPTTISINNPTNKQNFAAGVSITVDAIVTGSVTNVSFFADGGFIGRDTNSPYSLVYSNSAVGPHALTAVATDTTGASVTSAVINITNVLVIPTVVITAPTNTQVFSFPGDITITATANAGVVTNVAFYVDGALIGNDTSNPYSVVYSNAPVGGHALTAVVRDNLGQSVTSAVVNITVVLVPPTVVITAPTNTQNFPAGGSLTVSANVTGSVTNVGFYSDGVLIGNDTNSPYSLVYSNASTGGHVLTAVVRDIYGQSVTSAAVNITLTVVAPTVVITAPTNTQNFIAGTNITINANATGSVTNVGFYANGVLIGNDPSSPYSFVYSNAPAGARALTAVVQDNLGQRATSAVVNITNILVVPTVAIIAPANGQSFLQGLDITINVSVTGGVLTNVSFYRDGGVLIGNDASSPFGLNYSGATLGAHTLTAVVRDNLGQSATSAVVNITVSSGPGISVGLSGAGPFGFAALPTVQDGWTTTNIFGGGGDLSTPVQFDAHIQTNSLVAAPNVTGALPTDTNPVPVANSVFRWNSAGSFIQSRAVSTKLNLLMATLRNDAGADVGSFNVSYAFGEVAGGHGENIPGFRVYYSMSGAAGSWQLISALSTGTTGALTATIPVGNWQAGTSMYLLWGDDNASGNEGSYTIDNFAITTVVTNAAQPVSITSQPPNLAREVGQSAVFTVGVSGSSPYFYAWYFGGNPIGGANGPTYTIPSVSAGNAGQYHVVVSNSFSSAISSNALLTVTNFPVVITNQPVGAGVAIGGSATFNVGVSGTPPFFYQWYFGASPIANATNSSYAVNNAQPANGGIYTVQVSNLNNTVTSSNANLVVIPGPYTLVAYSNVWKYNQSNVDLGTVWKDVAYDDSGWSSGQGLLAFEPDALPEPIRTQLVRTFPGNGSQTLTYYFRTKVVLSDVPTAVTFAVTNLIDDGAVFYVNGEEVYRLNMLSGPVNHNTLASGNAAEGTPVGTSFPSTPWVKGTNVLAVEVHQSAAGSSDIVFGMKITATTLPSTLITITNHPKDLIVEETKQATFTAGVSGVGAQFQWFKDGTPIPGAEAATYTIPISSTNDIGSYSLMASNAVNAVFSSNAFLIVIADTNGPTLVKADGTANSSSVLVSFSELVSEGTANDLENYDIRSTLGAVVQIYSATRQNGTNVLLVTGPRFEGVNYILTVNNVRDLALASNVILPNSAIPVTSILYLAPLTGLWDWYQPLPGLDPPPTADWKLLSFLPEHITNNWAAGPFAGEAAFVADLTNEPLPVSRRTTLSLGAPDVYFRRVFVYSASPLGASARFRHMVDDTAVFHLNNVQFFSFNSGAIGVASLSAFINLPLSSLAFGSNVLAVQLNDQGNNDMAFAMELQVQIDSVTNGPVVIAGQPANQTVLVGQPASFSVSPVAALTVQWQRNGTNIAGATNLTYTVPATTLAMIGDTFRAVATGPGGSATSSNALLNVYVAAPTVVMTSPTNTESFAHGSDITLSANASGSVSNVSFYSDGALVGTDTNSPYSLVYSNATPGAHVLTAVVQDIIGQKATSAVVNITVTLPVPTVVITSPAEEATFAAGTNITINASASGGVLTNVAFFVDGVLIGNDPTSPYSFIYPNAAAGSRGLTAVVQDNQGQRATSGVVTITVTGSVLPSLEITRSGGGVVTLTWTGSGYTLQHTATILGTNTPWADVPGPVTTSPYTTNNPAGSRFYRLR